MRPQRHWSTERISHRVLYALTGVTVVAYALFALVGFNIPYEQDPDMNAPLFTDLLLWLGWITLFLSLVLAVVSTIHSHKLSPRKAERNGIAHRRLSFIVWLVVILCLGLTFAIGSTAPMLINGEDYEDPLWLRVADMFVYTSLALLAAAVGAMVFGATRYIRKNRKGGKP